MSRRFRPFSVFLALALAAAVFAACGPGEDSDAAGEAEAQAQLDQLQAQHAEWVEKNDELEAMRARLEAARAGELEDEEEVDVEALAAETETAANRLAAQGEDLGAAVVEFLNAHPPIQGEPLSDVQRQAIAIKADLDMAIANEYIDRGGDYRRAIQIYDAILVLDPENERVLAARAEAEDMRFVTEERFSQVENGMTEDEVRELLGPVNLRNVRDYPDQPNVKAWLYPKNDQGAGAVVYFRQRSGTWQVYRTEFNPSE